MKFPQKQIFLSYGAFCIVGIIVGIAAFLLLFPMAKRGDQRNAQGEARSPESLTEGAPVNGFVSEPLGSQEIETEGEATFVLVGAIGEWVRMIDLTLFDTHKSCRLNEKVTTLLRLPPEKTNQLETAVERLLLDVKEIEFARSSFVQSDTESYFRIKPGGDPLREALGLLKDRCEEALGEDRAQLVYALAFKEFQDTIERSLELAVVADGGAFYLERRVGSRRSRISPKAVHLDSSDEAIDLRSYRRWNHLFAHLVP